ncbi:MAG: hypothetical protein POH28_14710 [Acidocella sp.]|nr:hypothetical protein [Acidocella sp.]
MVYVAESLNIHRRHEGGVTARLDAKAHLKEIERLHAVAVDLLAPGAATMADQAAYLRV